MKKVIETKGAKFNQKQNWVVELYDLEINLELLENKNIDKIITKLVKV